MECLYFLFVVSTLSYKKDIIDDMKDSIIKEAKKTNENAEILDVILSVHKEDSHIETSLKESIGSKTPRLYGSGMLIVNVPWKIQEQIESALPFISDCLGVDGNGAWQIKKY